VPKCCFLLPTRCVALELIGAVLGKPAQAAIEQAHVNDATERAHWLTGMPRDGGVA
jgi:hypothetical protein